jgi:glycosyltransferase involved in cell wall biosynthesis
MLALLLFLSFLPISLLPLARLYNPNVPEYKGKVDAIVPLYKESPCLHDTLKSLLKHGFNVIVVASQPTKQTLEILSRWRVKAILSRKRLSKARAINRALKHLRAPYVLICDADLILRRMKIPCIGEDVGVVSFPIRTKRPRSLRFKLTDLTAFVWEAQHRLSYLLGNTPCYGAWGLMLLRRERLKQLKMRDVLGCEADLQFRTARLGLRNFLYPKVDVLHDPPRRKRKNFLGAFTGTYKRLAKDALDNILRHWAFLLRCPSFLFLSSIFILPYALLLGIGIWHALNKLPILSFAVFAGPIFVFPFSILSIYIQIISYTLPIILGFLVRSLAIGLTMKLLNKQIDYKLLPLHFFVWSPLLIVSSLWGVLEGIWQKLSYGKIYEEYEGVLR